MAEAEGKERKILVAVDEGEESSYALSWCLTTFFNRNYQDTLVLLFAKRPRAVYSSLDGSGYLFSADILDTIEKHSDEVGVWVMEKANLICKDFDPAVKVDAKVERGDPRDVICQVAEKLNVDLVVMGSHGYGAIKRAFLGSVSNHCAQNLKCPVLIVKKPKSNQGN